MTTADHDAAKAGKADAITLRNIENDEQDLAYRKEAMLRKLGWVYSSSYPDCCWRWSKPFGGKVITDDTHGAYALELSLLDDEGDEE